MPPIPEISFDEVSVSEKYVNGQDIARCKSGLWGIHNVIKNITAASHPRVTECLLMIGANAEFENDSMLSLIYGGKTNKKYKRNMPAARYLFELESFGFIIYDIDTPQKEAGREALSVRDMERFSITYSPGDFADVIFGLKLFSDICVRQASPLSCFLAGDIRVAAANAPMRYAPPAEELFGALPEGQRRAALAVHEVLERMGCVRELEGESAVRYRHRGRVAATIWAGERLWFLPESEREQKVVFKLNLRNIGKYADYLSECTEGVISSILDSVDCGLAQSATGKCGNGQSCGGIALKYNDTPHIKCTRYFCTFKDLSEPAVINYIRLIELEDRENPPPAK